MRRSRHTVAGWLGRARASAMLGRIAEAHADAEQALRLAPRDPQVRLLASMLDQRLGRVDEA
ncbi:MAG: tetratricopeptide repeat protein, partial [bacterium]